MACVLPDCSHYIPVASIDLLENKTSICNRCGEPFLMNRKHITLAKPHCDECTIYSGKNPFQKHKIPKIKKDSALSELLSKAILGNHDE